MGEDVVEHELTIMKAGTFVADFRKAIYCSAECYSDLWSEIIKRTRG